MERFSSRSPPKASTEEPGDIMHGTKPHDLEVKVFQMPLVGNLTETFSVGIPHTSL